MSEATPQFGNLSISRRADGKPVVLQRGADETTFLAFDNRIRRLVELHVLGAQREFTETGKLSAQARGQLACEVRLPSLMRVLEVGEDNGLLYYTSNLNEGEFVEDYIQRRGALSAPTTFALVFQLLEDLLQLKNRYPRLISGLTLNHLLVGTVEDTFLQLRVVDYGLAYAELDDEPDYSELVREICQLLYLMLTGKPHAGDSLDRVPILTQLPTSLRTSLRTSLGGQSNAPSSLEKIRDEVREAFSILSGGMQSKNLRKHLVVIGPLQPESQLQSLLLENVPVQTIFGTHFHVEEADQPRRYPFSIPAVHSKTEQLITVHMLPPSRIVDRTHYETVPLQMWRFNPERHPNILRSLTVWESTDWTFLTEEREPGFTLSRLMAERVALNPAEILVLMKQVRAGLEQAQECGVARLDLHPSNILLRVGKHGPALQRETERLMQRRLDAWPAFCVKLRPHMTMRSLYEPHLLDFELPKGALEEHIADRDFRHRSFIMLTAYLLAGERQTGGVLQFPESVPESTAAYMREACEQTQQIGKAPSPADFLARFEASLSAGSGTIDLAERLRGNAVPLEMMESAGAVSDFDDENQTEADDEPASDYFGKQSGFRPYAGNKEGLPWIVWAAAAVILLGLVGWWLLDRPVDVDHGGNEVSQSTAAAQTAPAESPPKAEPPRLPPAEAPKPTTTEKTPVIIRKAQLPSPEELEKARQGQTRQDSIGRLPPAEPKAPAPVADTTPPGAASN